MPLMSKPSNEGKIAIIFVTVGALTIVWSGIWLWYQHDNTAAAPWERYVCYGCLFSGVVVTGIGFALGRIARAARQAELPPEEVTHTEGQISHEAASRAPIVTPVGVGGAAVTDNNGAVAGVNPAAGAVMNPAAPVASVVGTNPANPPNPAANSTPAARF